MIGETISHYRILDPLGSGGMGQVFRAEDTRLGRQVALKFLSVELARDPASLERFQREARAASSLNHPGICTIYEIGEEGARVFLAMEYLEGETLRDKIAGKPVRIELLLEWALSWPTHWQRRTPAASSIATSNLQICSSREPDRQRF